MGIAYMNINNIIKLVMNELIIKMLVNKSINK